jgi:hypothetical protein
MLFAGDALWHHEEGAVSERFCHDMPESQSWQYGIRCNTAFGPYLESGAFCLRGVRPEHVAICVYLTIAIDAIPGIEVSPHTLNVQVDSGSATMCLRKAITVTVKMEACSTEWADKGAVI